MGLEAMFEAIIQPVLVRKHIDMSCSGNEGFWLEAEPGLLTWQVQLTLTVVEAMIFSA